MPVKPSLPVRALPLLSLGAAAAAWEAACRLGLVSPVLLSPPSAIAAAGWSLAASGALGPDLVATLSAFAWSLLLAAAVGIAAGAAMGASPLAAALLDPWLTALNAVPKIALLPVVVLAFGLGRPPAVFLGALMGAFPVAVSVHAGMRGLERDFVMLARAFGASRLVILRAVILPGLLPHCLASLRIAINYCLVGVLLVEFFAADRGLGYRMLVFSSNFQTAPFFALLLFVMGLALALSAGLRRLERRLTAWRPEALE